MASAKWVQLPGVQVSPDLRHGPELPTLRWGYFVTTM
jgi:hypothetical protein